MQYLAEIDIMPLEALLDPAGKAVSHSMATLGLGEISKVRIGKHIQLTLEADSKEAAEQKVEEACKRLLANEIMEKFTFSVTELQTA
mgnify:CR=1 FL=1